MIPSAVLASHVKPMPGGELELERRAREIAGLVLGIALVGMLWTLGWRRVAVGLPAVCAIAIPYANIAATWIVIAALVCFAVSAIGARRLA